MTPFRSPNITLRAVVAASDVSLKGDITSSATNRNKYANQQSKPDICYYDSPVRRVDCQLSALLGDARSQPFYRDFRILGEFGEHGSVDVDGLAVPVLHT